MNIIAKLSFWIKMPLRASITKALEEFKRHGYVEKLKTHITPESIPSDKEKVVTFLCDIIIHI